jgi:LPXTG-motif cell wall-anchored protein
LTAPVGDPLQAGSTSEDLKVLISSESDGAPINVSTSDSLSDLPGLLLAGLILLSGTGFIIFSRRKERRI